MYEDQRCVSVSLCVVPLEVEKGHLLFGAAKSLGSDGKGSYVRLLKGHWSVFLSRSSHATAPLHPKAFSRGSPRVWPL